MSISKQLATSVPTGLDLSQYITSHPTQPGHPSMGRRIEYQPKGSDAMQLGSKGRYGSSVGSR